MVTSVLIMTDTAPGLKPSTLTLAPMRLAHIAAIFNLIQDGSAAGHFTPVYTLPHYMAGLAMQLFSLLLRNRITLPDGSVHRARTRVLLDGGRFAGFIILLDGEASVHVYMCAVRAALQRQGHGRWMLAQAIAAVPAGHVVVADCLPASLAMMAVLRKCGFARALGPVRGGARRYVRLVAPPRAQRAPAYRPA
jgi:RimJ/RimL family protein N-acetyltransferase